MIEGMDKVLENHGQPGLTELRGLLQELLGGREAEGRLIEEQTLQPRALRVFRLRFGINGKTRQVIVKRLKPKSAPRRDLIRQAGLPAVRLVNHGPALLGRVRGPRGRSVW